ncbi:glycosyltransferase involved in cell wall biosynthesis [Kibdelosporangium banguiense]|uniref:Glycosyltransferase involved in cell wall biosynthesis n=1 Tax=Kibdelosporangium banguiense TaxID=1365924 RepID=A0ABS4U1S7_9PSEU|nr:glycosyltransferase [Kibdelosporangium banguiense]MBP2330612.1 glycosyltransferase involved in cell wall biosynthesis [Kibdelosporangium banguiense]
MTRKLSIITAAYSPLADYFSATIESVQNQELPSDWELEWLVQEDGETPTLGSVLSGVPYVVYSANKAHTGIAATRNLALTRATGSIVHILDHDDVMLPGALSRLLPLFEGPEIHWTVGQADDLLPDGSRRAYESALPFGPIPAGTVNDWAIAHDGNWPIHCAGLYLRTELVRAFGGWGGTPVDDDIIMFSALSECVGGYNSPETTWLYRVHDRQTHRSAQWRERSSDGRRIALQRIEAMRSVGLQVTGDPAKFDSAKSVNVGPAAKDTAEGRPWWKESH